MNIVKLTRADNVVCEHEARIAQDRILSVEKHFSELCSVFGTYTRKVAGVRDINDELAKVLQSYSTDENINKTLKHSLGEVSGTLSEIGDYRNLHVERLEKKVVHEFVQYESVCRNAKEEVKNIFSARDRELSWRRQLEKVKEKNPLNRQQITTAESELVKATAEVSRTQRALEEQMEIFEKRKLHDIKTLLLEFIKIEISAHAKMIELFTRGYQDIMQIDETEDLEDFQEVLKVPETAARLETAKRTSLRNASLLSSLFSTPRKPPKSDSSGNISSQITTANTDLVESLKANQEDEEEEEEASEEEDAEDDDEDESSSILSVDNTKNKLSRISDLLKK